MFRSTLGAFLLAALAGTAVAQPDDVTAPPDAPEADAPPAPPGAVVPTLTEADIARIVAAQLAARDAAAAVVEPTAPPIVAPIVAPAAVPVRAPAAVDGTGFRFGSYGRIIAGTDLRGGSPAPVAVVVRAPRLVEPSYLELDFSYGFQAPGGPLLRTVTTLAFADTLFHYTGEFDAEPALRNVYAEALWSGGSRVWVGSRMYRGDDIYLFDYWPLDDQNTLGAGAGVRVGAVDVAAHVGVNRLLDAYQYQEEPIADPELGATTSVQLDRQRTVASATATYFLAATSDLDAKVKLHGELQGLPSGTRNRGDDTTQALPRDWGTTLGAQLGVWEANPGETGHRRHANLFARWSRGLAAYDELAPPTGFDTDLKTYPRASELVLGLGGGWDGRWGNVVLGAYARRFVDADPNQRDVDDGWEYAANVRPLARVARGVFAGVDLAYQARFPRGLMPSTQLAADPGVVSIGPMLTYSPLGPSAFDRPQLRLVYRAAHLNEGALALYAEDDPRRAHRWVHFLGAQAEWWFNSSSYR